MRVARGFKAALLAAVAWGQSAAAAPPVCPPGPVKGVPAALGPRLLLDANFPDPFVARFRGLYQAYATGAQGGDARINVQRVASRDLMHWTPSAEALPSARLPAWVDRENPQVWAPEVMELNGRYLMYFNARHASLTRTEVGPEGSRVLKRHCLGVAASANPEGPFVGLPNPLVCAGFADGAIDPSPFRDGGKLYLYFKADGNCCGRPSALYGQRLTADGTAAVGTAHKLIRNDDSPSKVDDWEWRVVEAPTMVRRGRGYYLFYSGNFYGNRNYSVGYLACSTPLGPCRDRGHNPILWSHPASPLIGPGHQSVLRDGTQDRLFFHAWNRDPDGKEQAAVHKRCLYTSSLGWGRSRLGEVRPRIAGGTPGGR